ncbi:DUF3046 domain-containing protein [Specibacter cremeus]|uniref:DUF3046 domain-containing protein n=1 Tax=Specibacter cremeus TaxID=1629051 RepID=UPI000F7A7168|nr:DUF3046 domain-containing protein [Specibacter cremeus]
MRVSDFWRLMDDEFGSGYAHVLARELVLRGVGGHTAEAALRAGYDPREVWLEVCEVQDVPQSRRLGRDVAPRG